MRREPLLLLLSLPLMLAGCLGVPRPAPVTVAGADAGWIEGGGGTVADDWWRGWGDAGLNALVEAALHASPDIAEAQAHLKSARAQSQAAGGAELPVMDASGSAARSRQTLDGLIPLGRIPGFARDNTLYDVGFDASWEPDFWAGARSGTAAASARASGAAAQLAGVRLAVVAEVVRNVAQLRAAQAQRASIIAEADLQTRLVALHQVRLAAGEAGRDPLITAEQRLEALHAAIPTLDAQIRAAAYALGVLTARPPEAMLALAETPAPPLAAPDVAVLGLRSEVLRRRPDVMAAEADLAATTADIGVARAALFPHITLAGAIGQQALGGLDLTSAASTRFSAGPTLSWPIFAAGQLKARLRGARADAEASADRYEKAILSALADSETAANRFAKARQTEQHQLAALRLADDAARLSTQRERRGEDSALDALQVRAADEAARQTALAASAGAIDAYISLCKALGGGAG